MEQISKRPTWSRWRELLDGIATVVVIGAAVVVLWGRFAQPRPVAAPEPRIELPTAPLDLAGAHTKGNLDARVVVVEYSDFQCPFCAQFARETQALLDERYVRDGKVLWAFRHLPLERLHPLARHAAEVAECAGQQGRFWPVHDRLFSDQTLFAEPSLLRDADTAGLDAGRLTSCMQGDGPRRVQHDVDEAQRLGITSTPAFLIGLRQLDHRVEITASITGAQPIDHFASVLDGALGKSLKTGTQRRGW